ncbi:MAG: hypothetical protein NUV54_02500 [Candidatus Taylorbacteria bacterium]|nr:hypothetical protein [Candidatus Taylorbacteria bacterium]
MSKIHNLAELDNEKFCSLLGVGASHGAHITDGFTFGDFLEEVQRRLCMCEKKGTQPAPPPNEGGAQQHTPFV